MKISANDFMKMLETNAVSYSIDGDNLKIEDEFLNGLLQDEELKNEVLALLKPRDPDFKLEITNADLSHEPVRQPRPQVKTNSEKPVKPENKTQTDFYIAPHAVQPVSPFAYALYYELCSWLHEYASYENWIDFEMVVNHLRDENFKFDEMEIRQALRELAVKGHLHRKGTKEYSLIGDNDLLAERLRAERKTGKHFTEMCFYRNYAIETEPDF